MKYGAIDIGTNSMRLLLTESKGKCLLDRKKYINTTRLGQGIDKDGVISEESIELNIKALKEFAEKCVEYNCDKVFCIGTAALRNAKNKEEFVKRAKLEAGIDVEIISGEREALLGYVGVTKGVDIGNGEILILDIGGGSTEFIFGDKNNIFYRKSINIGALVLTERFISSMPEETNEMNTLKKYINEEISAVIRELKKEYVKENSEIILFGIGGTITSISAINQKLEIYSMEKVHKSIVNIKEINKQIEEISSMNLSERKNIKGLQPKRAEIILSGELILKSIMDNLSLDRIQISEFDNLEGIILEDVSKLNTREEAIHGRGM